MLTRLLRTYLVRYRRDLSLVVLFQTIQSIAALYLPSLTADIIDRGVLRRDNHYIWTTGGVMLAITVLQVVANVIAIYYGSRVATAFGRDVRSSLFHQVTGYSAREVGHFGAPSLITRVTNDVQQVQMFVVMVCTIFIGAPIMCVGGIFMALREDVGLSWVITVAVPVMVAGVGLIVWRMVPEFRRMQDRIDAVNQVLREQLTGIRVVRAFVREPAERKRFEAVNRDLTDTSLRAGHLQALIFPVVVLVMNGSSIAVLWIGAGRIDDRSLKIGALIAFLTYLVQILMAVMMATFIAVMAPRATVCAERINEVLDTESSVRTAAAPVTELTSAATLELRDVSFQYPGAEAPVLSGIDFIARPGQTTAIIGSTGSGKTTLVNLIPRLFDCTDGAVLIGGVDVKDLAPEVLWSQIGLVPQRPYLFSGTVASNLRFSKPDATDDELWEALEIAQGADFVRAMPEGLDSPITQGGTNVSGGQRQRLAIARALVRKPAIYLFDDSFSALDLATDARLRAALKPHTADATVIIVAQRVSTIVDADQIIVLEDGSPVGIGSHAELLENCPTYLEIVDSQRSAEEAA